MILLESLALFGIPIVLVYFGYVSIERRNRKISLEEEMNRKLVLALSSEKSKELDKWLILYGHLARKEIVTAVTIKREDFFLKENI